MRTIHILLVILIIIQSGCKKFLDEKPSLALVVPHSLKDLRALLDNDLILNQGSTPALTELAADNLYITTEDWQTYLTFSFTADECLNYIWDKDATLLGSWQWPYRSSVYYANVVLDALDKIEVTEANKNEWSYIKGTALFYRAFAFERVAQLYCSPYSIATAADPGVVLKLSSSINEGSERATVQETYDRIINDLKEAAILLPEVTDIATRPTKAAAYGALARTCLSMRDYGNAGNYANSCLQQNSALIDYNTLIPVGFPPVSRFNTETIFYNTPVPLTLLFIFIAKVDSTLYQSYDNNDLRKEVFFQNNGNNTYGFRGGYNGNADGSPFDGLTTAEMYLIRAECSARAGNADSAISDLNRLMINRWRNDNNSWMPFTATNEQDALNKILIERRKELCFRGVRWSDLRRLNLEGGNITLKRIIGGVTYTLPPNDLRWVMLIPKEEVNFSEIQQNPR